MSATPDHEPSRASADEPTPTASSIDPSHAIVEADPLLDERKLLGLPPTGLLSSGQIEAAMGLRAQDIRHHPMGESHKARRVLHLLEAAADRLQAQLALAARGPLHPQAAKRVAARLAVTNRTAARLMVVSPEQRSASMGQVIARDLTDFDRLALAVLVVSRGWNATSAKRLASVADEHGVAVADLERVVDGLTRFLAEGGGVRGNIGDIGEGARLSMRSPRAMRSLTNLYASRLRASVRMRVCTGERLSGRCKIVDTSRSPYTVSESVRGIGVAVITRISTASPLSPKARR